MNDLSTLSDYRNIAFQLAGDLEAFHDLAEDLRLAAILPQIDDLLARVRSHTFSVAVVGEFKRGKSTFINALLGREVLPADIAPTSATLNRVTYGHEPKVRVYYRGTSGQPDPHEDIAINQLAEFVTKLTPQAEAIANRVREAVVHFPLPYLQTNNLDLIDTPGLNDETGQTEITMSVLSRVDAAIMVLMATSPLAESERIFLDQLLAQGLGRMIFVVTGLDRLATADQRERVMQHISNGIVETIRAYAARRYSADTPEYGAYLRRYDRPLVCGLSGYQALLALQQNDQARLDESGLPAFNRALGRYMTYERGAQMLLTQAGQIARFGEVMRQALELQVASRRARQQQADAGRAGAEHKHFADGAVQGRLPALVALKDLGPKAPTGAGHQQVLTLTGGGDQVAGIIAIAPVPAFLSLPIAWGANKGRDFFVQENGQRQPDGRTQLLVQRFLKISLTQRCWCINLRCRSGRHGVLGYNLVATNDTGSRFFYTKPSILLTIAQKGKLRIDNLMTNDCHIAEHTSIGIISFRTPL